MIDWCTKLGGEMNDNKKCQISCEKISEINKDTDFSKIDDSHCLGIEGKRVITNNDKNTMKCNSFGGIIIDRDIYLQYDSTHYFVDDLPCVSSCKNYLDISNNSKREQFNTCFPSTDPKWHFPVDQASKVKECVNKKKQIGKRNGKVHCPTDNSRYGIEVEKSGYTDTQVFQQTKDDIEEIKNMRDEYVNTTFFQDELEDPSTSSVHESAPHQLLSDFEKNTEDKNMIEQITSVIDKNNQFWDTVDAMCIRADDSYPFCSKFYE